ncbi:unnamed protein product [Onchocerca ochengi]|uniref:ATP-dependent DNA helicase n=1 Tax=Onchocerca ochengi TaxID=42157 RepID=A0A182E9M4_ONCOC|nr:unnamed protein product [Onchocerca ochengi]
MQTVSKGVGEIFFLDAPGGAGKAYLTLATIRFRNGIALALASFGIAATLLPGKVFLSIISEVSSSIRRHNTQQKSKERKVGSSSMESVNPGQPFCRRRLVRKLTVTMIFLDRRLPSIFCFNPCPAAV